MKTLLSTTALALALILPSQVPAQTAPAPDAAQTGTTGLAGFLATRGQTDVFASELMGHEVHARRAATGMAPKPGQAGIAQDGSMGLPMMRRAELEAMDNIGQINDIVVSPDGQVRAIVIGIGGFLGAGEQDVAVTMDQVTFAADPDDRSQMYIVVNTGTDLLRSSPSYDRMMMTDPAATVAGAPVAGRPMFTPPRMAREGYNRIEATQVSSEMLTGKSVYGINDRSVGTVEDLIMNDAGMVTEVIIDFGGFLGMGSSQVALDFDELTILANEGNADVRVYVDATKDQIQALPQFQATN